MKRLLILALVVIFYSVPSFAQGGMIGLYLDTWGEICDFHDCGDLTVLEIQVVHKIAPCATASQFMIVASPGFTGTYLGEEVPITFCGLGNSQYGVAIAYGDLYASPVHILTVRYLVYGTSEPNSYLEVVGDPLETRYDSPVMTDCTYYPVLYPAVGGRTYINGDGTLSCSTTPAEPKTWGQIKALYKN